MVDYFVSAYWMQSKHFAEIHNKEVNANDYYQKSHLLKWRKNNTVWMHFIWIWNNVIYRRLITSSFMRKVWNNVNPPPRFVKNHARASKLVLNYARYSGTHPCIKRDRTLLPKKDGVRSHGCQANTGLTCHWTREQMDGNQSLRTLCKRRNRRKWAKDQKYFKQL
jgi:hypothetical protein